METPKAEEAKIPEVVKDNLVNNGTEAYKKAKAMIELGVLEDFSIQVSDDDEDGTAISDFKDMSEENLKEIVKIYQQEKDTNISSNYISKEGLKEHQLKVIEILKNGGDLSKIAETPDKAFERPFEGFDMEDQKRQIDVRYSELVHEKKLDHDTAITIIDGEIKKGKIEETSKSAFERYRKSHADYIDSIAEQQRKDKEFRDMNFKENKKTLTAKLKEAGLKESVYKKVAAEYGKLNEQGEHQLIDKLKEALSNPEENHELILHLADKKLFNETFRIKASQEQQKTIVRLASSAQSKGNRKTLKDQDTNLEAPWLKAARKYNESITN